MRANNSGDKIRIISDNVRFESVGNVSLFNVRSGEDLLRYVRGRLLDHIPILIGSISCAKALYVKEFPLAGSTHDPDIAMNFIRSMVERVERFDESMWTKVDATMSQALT